MSEGYKAKLNETFSKIGKATDKVYEFIAGQAKLVKMHPILYTVMIIILIFTLGYVLWLSRLYNVQIEHYKNTDTTTKSTKATKSKKPTNASNEEDTDINEEDTDINEDTDADINEEDTEPDAPEEDDTIERRPTKLTKPRNYRRPEPKRARVLTKRATVTDKTPTRPITASATPPKRTTKSSFIGRVVEKFLAYLP